MNNNNMIDVEKIVDQTISLGVEYGPKLIGAILVWIIGSWIIKGIVKGVGKLMDLRKTESTLRPFMLGIATTTLKIMLIISVLGMLGVETTSFVAILAAAGLAVGLALGGTLQNFAGGVMIMIFKPFKIGDFIQTQGHSGTVKEIKIFVTVLLTPQNRAVYIPNGPIANSDLVNFTAEERVRVDLVFGISYDADIGKARDILMGILTNHPQVLKDPAPTVTVLELGDSAVNLAVRAHTTPSDYWTVHFDTYEKGKVALDKAKIGIPYPQVDVHMQNK